MTRWLVSVVASPRRGVGLRPAEERAKQSISLTPEQDAYIEEVLKAGDYRNASEAVRDAIRALQQRRAIDALKLERLRRSIDSGLADLERGDYEQVDDADLEAWLDRVGEPARS